MQTNSNRPILLVEDNPDDVFLMKRAFHVAEINTPLQVAGDGEQALYYLSGKPPFADREALPVPRLVLLDLKLPFISGHEVLKWMRENDSFRLLPVLVLTSSAEDSDVEQAYRTGANSYLVKPTGWDGLVELTRQIKEYWLTLNIPPPTFR